VVKLAGIMAARKARRAAAVAAKVAERKTTITQDYRLLPIRFHA
jgi:hypothetical protein